MTNFYDDNDDLQFYMERGIDWAPLIRLTERDFRLPDGFTSVDEATSSYKDVLTMVGEFVAEQIAPHAAELDRTGLHFKDGEVEFPPRLAGIFEQIKELGLYGMCMPRELGGMNCPLLLQFMAGELFARGDVSVLTHYSFHGAIAEIMLTYSMHEGTTTFDCETGALKETRFANEIKEIISGREWGSMDITEPNAGSDMASLGTRAVLENDQWSITGQKIFITSGHGKYHIVIARTEDAEAEGLKALSLFLVPAFERRDGVKKRLVHVERIEEKLGHHNSATCVVSFDRTPGYLIGKRGEGFKLMLHLMNGARIAVGFEGLGLSEAAFRTAAAYAAERPSMGKTIDKHEMIADYLDEMATDIQAIRAISIHGGYHEEMAQRTETALKYHVEKGSLEEKRLKRELRKHRTESRRVTPLVKYLAAEKAVEIARRGLQIHGGVGYSKEYGAERLLREAIAVPIYEGTSQIQSLMAMKDNLGAAIKNPQEFVKRVAQARWRAVSARDVLERRVAKLQSLCLAAQQHLLSRTATEKLRALTKEPLATWPQAFKRTWDPKRDFAFAMLHAERLTKMLCDATIAELLLEQVQRHDDRREVLERFLERAEPRSRYLLDEICTTGERLLAKLEPRALDENEQSA